MTDDELEREILQRFVDKFKSARTGSDPDDKRARELDMREVIRELTSKAGSDLEYETERWYGRLVERPHGRPNAPLRPGVSGDKYGARAFRAGTAAPAWDRLRELQRLAANLTTSQITVNIDHSTVAGLNLGTVLGNIEASITVLQQADPEVATALTKLVEAVLADETLGDRRRDVVESLNQVAEEAKKPVGSRNVWVARTLLVGIGYILSHSANLAQIWQTWSKPIRQLFGLPDQ